MNLTDRNDWDDFVYILLYPGLLGSMIYELIPKENLNGYLNTATYIRLAIILFYCIDFLHLYADMKKVIKNELRPWGYVTCDLIGSVSLFMAFIFVKTKNPEYSLILLSIIPFITLVYKWKVKPDRWFFSIFGIISSSLTIYFFIEYPIELSYYEEFLQYLSLGMVTIYMYYVFIFYEKRSKKVYIENFS